MLSELVVSGKVDCDSAEKKDWVQVFSGERNVLHYSFKFEAKDQRIRLEYYNVKITLPDGSFTRSDFQSNATMVKTLDRCMGYLHGSLLKYINARHSNW
jgi:hypothetical protein